MAELAYGFHWPPSELTALTGPELVRWHDELVRLQRRLGGAG